MERREENGLESASSSMQLAMPVGCGESAMRLRWRGCGGGVKAPASAVLRGGGGRLALAATSSAAGHVDVALCGGAVLGRLGVVLVPSRCDMPWVLAPSRCDTPCSSSPCCSSTCMGLCAAAAARAAAPCVGGPRRGASSQPSICPEPLTNPGSRAAGPVGHTGTWHTRQTLTSLGIHPYMGFLRFRHTPRRGARVGEDEMRASSVEAMEGWNYIWVSATHRGHLAPACE